MSGLIWVVDDDERYRGLLVQQLRTSERGYEVVDYARAADALDALDAETDEPDLLVCDLEMPGIDGLELCLRFRRHVPTAPTMLITGSSGGEVVEKVVLALRKGVYDVLVKPVDRALLEEVVARALAHGRLLRDNELLRERVVAMSDAAGFLVGRSERMLEVCAQARAVAATGAVVLLEGESGSGKEQLARYIQRHSDRVDGPFVAVNCGALTDTLLESELFGHERGAFSGAVARHRGCFERAHGGTLLLDEVGELDAQAQVAFLRVLQENEVVRVGGSQPVPLDVRIICATNRDLRREVAGGRFRKDLYFRLSTFPLRLPPLRERMDDLDLLCATLLRRICARLDRPVLGIDPEALDRLRGGSWPGNIRQLEHELERAAILTQGDRLGLSDIPRGCGGDLPRGSGTMSLAEGTDAMRRPSAVPPAREPGPEPAVVAGPQPRQATDLDADTAERHDLIDQIQHHRWNLAATARALGISRSTLYLRMAKHGIER